MTRTKKSAGEKETGLDRVSYTNGEESENKIYRERGSYRVREKGRGKIELCKERGG